MLPLAGIFVGGRGLRMGGVPKGLLPLSDGSLLLGRLLRTLERTGVGLPVVLVGDAEAYTEFDTPALADAPAGIGPLGGLRALLLQAAAEGRPGALALSCDLPFITSGVLTRLIHELPAALALAPREESLWSPLTARYSVQALAAIDAAVSDGEHSLQRLFARLGSAAGELPLDETEKQSLRDWDRPEDIRDFPG
jgi:molybdopterin-guanine dinucleotide biosynthesis protein A